MSSHNRNSSTYELSKDTECNCIVCGKKFIYPAGVSGPKPKYCSKGCRQQYRQQFGSWYSDKKFEAHGELEKTCIVCGKKFKTYRGKKSTCSGECESIWKNRKHGDGRLNKSNIVDRDITLRKLYDMDNGICYLCGGKCDYTDIVKTDKTTITGVNYPSIDHVIPLSKGGIHAWSNVRLAHKGCNCAKGNR